MQLCVHTYQYKSYLSCGIVEVTMRGYTSSWPFNFRHSHSLKPLIAVYEIEVAYIKGGAIIKTYSKYVKTVTASSVKKSARSVTMHEVSQSRKPPNGRG